MQCRSCLCAFLSGVYGSYGPSSDPGTGYPQAEADPRVIPQSNNNSASNSNTTSGHAFNKDEQEKDGYDDQSKSDEGENSGGKIPGQHGRLGDAVVSCHNT